MFDDDYNEESKRTSHCSICNRALKPICETKTVDGIVYCIDCYKRDIYPLRMKKLRENKHE